MVLHGRVRALAPIVETREPAERACIARGKAQFLGKVVGARVVRVRVVETGSDGQTAVVALLVPAAVIKTSDRGQGRVLADLPVDFERDAVVANVLGDRVLGAVI